MVCHSHRHSESERDAATKLLIAVVAGDVVVAVVASPSLIACHAVLVQ